MNNSLRLQLLRTKRELQLTINQIDNILFYNPQINTRNQASQQFVDGLMNILSSRRNTSSTFTNQPSNIINPFSTFANTSGNPSGNTSSTSSNTSGNTSGNTSRNTSGNTSSNPSSNISGNTSSNTSSNPSGNTSSNPSGNIYNSILDNYNSIPLNESNVLPDLIEVTLYGHNTSSFTENVNVTPNINVLSNGSSIHIYSSLDTEFEQCTICRENFTENSIVRKINNCGHIFHINCIDMWFETNITCPVCRIDLRNVNTEEEIN